MTTKPKASKFRIRRPEAQTDAAPAAAAEARSGPPAAAQVDSPAMVAADGDMDAIRKEGLTGRQLRMARRVAQKHGLAVTSDFDAVRQLRERGIDPFQRNNVLELVAPDDRQTEAAARSLTPARGETDSARVQLPQTVVTKPNLPSTQLGQDKRGIAKRRRRKLALLMTRLAFFVMLPTLIAGWYFFEMATPMYGTKSEFVIQQAESQGASGFGGLFQGTGLANQPDSITVQSYLTSREAMLRLDADHDFKAHFQNPDIDGIQRLDAGASNEEAYKLFQSRVKVGYDPAEGVLQMEVIAADPDTSQRFAEALIGYAEDRVDQLTQRMRNDQMADAVRNFEDAEIERDAALDALLQAQQEARVVDPMGTTAALQQRISTLELEMDRKSIELSTIQANPNPNAARVSGVQGEIARIAEQIEVLRTQVTQGIAGGLSQAEIVAKLRKAEENYAFAVERVTAAQAAMDTSRIEASRQVRFLLVSVSPVAPDRATYPKAFENTLLAFLVFAGIYLMISLTASILREQVSS